MFRSRLSAVAGVLAGVFLVFPASDQAGAARYLRRDAVVAATMIPTCAYAAG